MSPTEPNPLTGANPPLMDQSSPDQIFVRFQGFWIVLGLVLLVAVAGAAVRWVAKPGGEIDAGAEQVRTATLQTVMQGQKQAVSELGLIWSDPQGGHLPTITVPDTLIAKGIEALKQKKAQKDESRGPIPGSKTFTEKAKSAHDPVESEVSKK